MANGDSATQRAEEYEKQGHALMRKDPDRQFPAALAFEKAEEYRKEGRRIDKSAKRRKAQRDEKRTR